MTNGQFFFTLGLNALVSLAISLGVSSYMVNQRDKVDEDAPVSISVTEYVNPEIKEMAERNKLLSEANVLIKQIELDEALSNYAGAEVVDAYKMNDTIEVKLQIEEGRRFCSMNNATLTKIKFYSHSRPLVKCSNGVID